MNDAGLAHELATLDLGDRRLNRRAVEVLIRLAQSPSSSPNAALQGWAEILGAYRLFDHPHCTEQALLQAHRTAVLERVRQQSRVLVIQDTTELDYTRHTQLEGRGPLAAKDRQGFFLHTQWVVTDRRLPLGAWHADIYAREPEVTGEAHRRKRLPIEKKESYRWLEGYRSACELAAQAPAAQVISCSDREGDIYEVFLEEQRRRQEHRPAAHWLIRCQQNRALLACASQPFVPGVDARLLAQVAQQPVLGGVFFAIKTKQQLKKVKGNRQRSVRQGRRVRQEIRVGQVTLRPPHRPGEALPEVTLWVVMATELDPPPGQDPIHWVLLTSLPVPDLETAVDVLELYLARWEIEVFHRVLKSGCRVEKLQFEDASRLKPALALYLIVAWRILYLMKLGREHPELPCEVGFDESEWKPLWVIVHRRPLPPKPPSLQEVILMMAQFGGHIGRKSDGPPGPETLWRGLQSLRCFSLAWETFGPNTS
jgi:hypothetical protein